jgi:hypothetical protein
MLTMTICMKSYFITIWYTYQGNLIGAGREGSRFFFQLCQYLRYIEKCFIPLFGSLGLQFLLANFFLKIIVINHKKCHQAISVSSKVINYFVFQRHISKLKLSHLWYAVYHRWPIFALLEDRWNTKRLITLELTEISWWHFLWLISTIMVWNDNEMVGVEASLSQPHPPYQG